MDPFPQTVLVVDDEPVVLQICGRFLPANGMKTSLASSAEEALALLATQRFGCMLTDKNLPGKDGIELIREARLLQPYLACIVMTGYESVESAVQALRLGATDYLTKPFEDIALVAEKVRLALKHQRDAWERDAFLQKIRGFESELSAVRKEADQQRSEIEMFNEILELRVQLALTDLTRERDELLTRMAPGAGGSAEIVGVEMAVILLRDIQNRETDASNQLRGELQRVVRQLESHIALLRKQARDDGTALTPR